MKKIILLAGVICLLSAQNSCYAQKNQLDEQAFKKTAKEDFDNLMKLLVSSIDAYAFLANLSDAKNAENEKIVESFKMEVWPLLVLELDRKKMSKKEGWLDLVTHLRNYDTQQDKRSNKWYLSKLMSLTIDLEYNPDNNAFCAGLAEAYNSITR
jgi:hypothetical protein